jgi:hypothetical protein
MAGFTAAAAPDFTHETVAVPDSKAPAAIYASVTAYQPESAKSAYVGMVVYGEHIRLQGDPMAKGNPQYYAQKMREKWNEAVAYADGATYRNGWAEALLKTGAQALSAAITKGRADGTLANLMVERGLDWLATPAGPLTGSLKSIIASNGITLQNMNNGTLLAELFGDTAERYLSDVNRRHQMQDNPKVKKERREQFVEEELKKIGLDVESLKRLARDKKQALEKADEYVADELQSVKSDTAKLLQLIQSEADRRAQMEELAARRAEAMGVIGIGTTIVRLTGSREEVAQMDRAANFAAQAVDTFVSQLTFEANPAAFVNMYAALGLAAVELFTPPQEDPHMKALQKIMEQLRVIQQQIIDLGQYVEKRFNALDRTLQVFVHETTAHLNQIITGQQDLEEGNKFFTSVLQQLQAQTYGAYVLSSRLDWMRLKAKCFDQAAITAQEFRACRNEIALYAIVGPPVTHSATAIGPAIMQSLIARLKRRSVLGSLPVESQPDPAAWLMAMNTMVKLSKRYPQHKNLIFEEIYDEDTGMKRADMLRVGEFYRTLMREMALSSADSGKPALRADLIREIVNEYQKFVYDTLIYTEGLPNKYFEGAPNPNLRFEDQHPSDNRNLYDFAVNGPRFCDLEKGEIQYSIVPMIDRNVQVGIAWYNSMAAPGMKNFKEHPEQVMLPPEFFKEVPNIVKLALTSAMKDRNRLSVRACFKNIQLADDPSPSYPQQTSRVNIELDLLATYMIKGAVKEFTLITMKMDRQFTTPTFGVFYDPGKSWMYHLWNGIPMTGQDSSSPLIYGKNLAIGPDYKKYFTITTPGLPEFEADFRQILQENVDQPVMEEIEGDFLYNNQVRKKREELAFVLERGLLSNQPAVKQLLGFIFLPQNLPDASDWARLEYKTGMLAEQMKGVVAHRLQILSNKIAQLEKSQDLKPGPDLFGPLLDELKEGPQSSNELVIPAH